MHFKWSNDVRCGVCSAHFNPTTNLRLRQETLIQLKGNTPVSGETTNMVLATCLKCGADYVFPAEKVPHILFSMLPRERVNIAEPAKR